MTRALKALLRQKNRPMHAGRTDEASALARRIGRIIQRRNSARLRRTNKNDLRDMWRKVHQLTGRRSRATDCTGLVSSASVHQSVLQSGVTADMLNLHYASVSTDISCEPPSPSPHAAVVPRQWKAAFITPIPKVTHPAVASKCYPE